MDDRAMRVGHRRQHGGDGPTTDSGLAGTFSFDSQDPRAGRTGFGEFLHGWRDHMPSGLPLPTFSRATRDEFRLRLRATRVQDVTVTSVDAATATRTARRAGDREDVVRLWVVHRGSWTLAGSRDGEEHTVSAGSFLVRHVERPSHCVTAPDAAATVVVLPAAAIVPSLGGRSITGPADAAEVRLLLAHAATTHRTAAGLGPAGVHAARNAMIELAKAVTGGAFDGADPRLSPALARAAQLLAERRLADRDLSPALLARELNVSVRTLQRAFAAGGGSVAGYIRDRRLEEARSALIAPSARPSVTEVAAHWHFADSSHFSRAFKRRYGMTPTDHARASLP